MAEEHGVEFTCVDCTAEVWAAFGPVPVPPRCAICLWLAAEVDPSEHPAIRAFLDRKVEQP